MNYLKKDNGDVINDADAIVTYTVLIMISCMLHVRQS